ncbi:MAG: SurA N-terminal domain-containing protein [Terracidiphilus sp.]
MHVESFFRAQSRFAIILVSLGFLLAASGCHPNPGADVVATVNGKEIMRADLDKQYKLNLGNAPESSSPVQADIMRLNSLRDMIDQEIVQQRAAKLNLTASDDDVNAKLTEIKAPYTEEEFNAQLKQRGLTMDDLKLQIRRQLTQTKLLNKEIVSKINITDGEISDFYNAHKADFNNIEPTVHLAQIQVTGAASQPGNMAQAHHVPSEADARKEIESIRDRILAGEDFGALASQFSENATTASNGGDMGPIRESQLKTADPEIYNAVMALRPSQITPPLPVYATNDPNRKVIGYQIYKLLEREPAGQRDLKDPRVQQFIRQQLHDLKAQLLENAYSETLHDQAKIHNYFAEQVLRQGAQ